MARMQPSRDERMRNWVCELRYLTERRYLTCPLGERLAAMLSSVLELMCNLLASLVNLKSFMHDSCMATKTISLELDAYERLKAAKGPGDSFSDVVRRATFPKKPFTAQDLLVELQKRGPMFSESELKDLEGTHDKLSTPPDDPWSSHR